jgi:hypothetical protein
MKNAVFWDMKTQSVPHRRHITSTKLGRLMLCKIWGFVTAFTRALHLYLSRARPIRSTTPIPISVRSILMLSIHLHKFICPSDYSIYRYCLRAEWPRDHSILDKSEILLLSKPQSGSGTHPSSCPAGTGCSFTRDKAVGA